MKHLFEDAIATQKSICLNKKYYTHYLQEKLGDTAKFDFYDEDSFYVDTRTGKGELGGRVRISLSVNPGATALANPVGTGRSEPNHSPFLPPPVGRISFTINPFTMFVSTTFASIDECNIKFYCYFRTKWWDQSLGERSTRTAASLCFLWPASPCCP